MYMCKFRQLSKGPPLPISTTWALTNRDTVRFGQQPPPFSLAMPQTSSHIVLRHSEVGT